MVKRKFTSRGGGRGKKMKYSRKSFRTGRSSLMKTSRTVEYSPITVGAADVTGALAFKLSDLPNYSDFDLFDEYMITGVKVYFVPGYSDQIADNGLGVIEMPTLLTAVDFDDSTAVNKDALMSNESCIIHVPGTKVDRYFKPLVSTTYWQSAVATGFGTNKATWLDTQSSPGVSHYGLKYVCSPGTATAAAGMSVRIFAKFYISFRKLIH